jgi:hypothetical protein
MNHFPLIAAGWADIIVPVIVFTIWIINQIVGAKRAAQPPAGRGVAKPNPPAGQPAGANPAGQGGLMDEVERFLKEARQAMDQQKQPPGRNVPPAKPQSRGPQTVPQKQQSKKPPKPPKLPAKQKGRVPLSEQTSLRSKLEQREREDVERGSSVSEHVQQHLDTSRFEERAGRLSHLKQTVEQDIGGHIHSSFDHKVGTLGEQAGTRTDAQGAAMTTDDSATGPNSVVQIVAMLRDPQSMRNAIILQEILSPPTHRW